MHCPSLHVPFWHIISEHLSRSQTSPSYPLVQLHLTRPASSRKHVALCWQGELSLSHLLWRHTFPKQPRVQTQVNPLMWSVHVPPLRHGSLAHSAMSVSQNRPEIVKVTVGSYIARCLVLQLRKALTLYYSLAYYQSKTDSTFLDSSSHAEINAWIYSYININLVVNGVKQYRGNHYLLCLYKWIHMPT